MCDTQTQKHIGQGPQAEGLSCLWREVEEQGEGAIRQGSRDASGTGGVLWVGAPYRGPQSQGSVCPVNLPNPLELWGHTSPALYIRACTHTHTAIVTTWEDTLKHTQKHALTLRCHGNTNTQPLTNKPTTDAKRHKHRLTDSLTDLPTPPHTQKQTHG